MNPPSLLRTGLALLALTAAAASAVAGELAAPKNPKAPVEAIVYEEEASPPVWRIRAGGVYRSFSEVSFSSGSYSAALDVPSIFGGSRTHQPSGIGPAGATGNRIYEDGFVRRSMPTPVTGDTWYFGYENASQIQGDSLFFRKGGGSAQVVRQHAEAGSSSWDEDGLDGWGPVVEVAMMVPIRDSFRAGPALGFMWSDFSASERSSNFSAVHTRQRFSVTAIDRYDLGGVILPMAPYSGPAGGPGPLIRNIPSSRSLVRSASGLDRAEFHNVIDEDIEVDIYTLSVGGQAEYDTGMLRVYLAAGLAVNFADISAARSESLMVSVNGGSPDTLRRWDDHADDDEILFGGFVQTGAEVQLSERLSAGGFVRYDFNEGIDGTVGPAAYRVDLDSFSAGLFLGISW